MSSEKKIFQEFFTKSEKYLMIFKKALDKSSFIMYNIKVVEKRLTRISKKPASETTLRVKIKGKLNTRVCAD